MTHERGRMRALLHPITVPLIAGMRHPAQSDEAALAALMMRAYVGTIDYEGEDEADALDEVRQTLAGDKGVFLWTASHVIERDGVLACATLVIRWQDQPLVAFTMTDVRFKRQGLGRACMLHSMQRLHAAGESELHLFVTLANHEAVSLYRSLGFVLQP
ncbi:MAG: GNAT family N-acetyltransferase [Rubrivivax sp.]|nr:GNAT family N-acetyltransferase [Rubrivivax sp.]